MRRQHPSSVSAWLVLFWMLASPADNGVSSRARCLASTAVATQQCAAATAECWCGRCEGCDDARPSSPQPRPSSSSLSSAQLGGESASRQAWRAEGVPSLDSDMESFVSHASQEAGGPAGTAAWGAAAGHQRPFYAPGVQSSLHARQGPVGKVNGPAAGPDNLAETSSQASHPLSRAASSTSTSSHGTASQRRREQRRRAVRRRSRAFLPLRLYEGAFHGLDAVPCHGPRDVAPAAAYLGQLWEALASWRLDPDLDYETIMARTLGYEAAASLPMDVAALSRRFHEAQAAVYHVALFLLAQGALNAKNPVCGELRNTTVAGFLLAYTYHATEKLLADCGLLDGASGAPSELQAAFQQEHASAEAEGAEAEGAADDEAMEEGGGSGGGRRRGKGAKATRRTKSKYSLFGVRRTLCMLSEYKVGRPTTQALLDLVSHALDYTAAHCLKRKDGMVMERVYTRAGQVTGAWRKWVPPSMAHATGDAAAGGAHGDDWAGALNGDEGVDLNTEQRLEQLERAQNAQFEMLINEIFPKEDGTGKAWEDAMGPSRGALLWVLKHCKDPQFEEVEPSPRYMAWENGVFDLRNIEFWEYGSPDMPPGLAAANYIPRPFEWDAVERSRDGRTRRYGLKHLRDGDAWMQAPTPNFDALFLHQMPDLCPEEQAHVLLMTYILVGRLFFPVGKHDNWQVIPAFFGKGGTGKSTFIEVLLSYFAREMTGMVPNNASADFGLEGVYNKLLWYTLEVGPNYSLDQALFQSMVTGEPVSVARKGKVALSLRWSAPGIICGNRPPAWTDKSGSLSRRIVYWPMEVRVSAKAADGGLKARMMAERDKFLFKCACAYRAATQRIGHANIWGRYRLGDVNAGLLGGRRRLGPRPRPGTRRETRRVMPAAPWPRTFGSWRAAP